ncbi:MAG: transketolase [Gammaproteobacteria bacterium]|nr:transketolase [Gammaproteobacteria bacterium]PCH63978.1 MAG: transketolase [Gammaproteobacteria bacterium]
MPSRTDLANAIRALSMDAVQKANSGHPGMPMGMADIAEVLWNDYLRHNPANPNWDNRDRFMLSNGHGSMLHYSLLHLTGYNLPMDEIKQFRQMGSKTPGHPEYGYTEGVETTTGPLGQGVTNAVGMAIAEKLMAARFNTDSYKIVDHFTYVFLGDGCLMEGISHEACSLAGTLGLGKLIAFYDDNGISIDGDVEGWFTDDSVKRFEAYGWHVIGDVDGHDPDALHMAIRNARAEPNKPTMICCKTVIGQGSPNKAGGHECHGAALGDEEIALTRENIGWPHAPFEIPDDIYAGWDAKKTGAGLEEDWNFQFSKYEEAYPELATEYKRRMAGDLPADWAEKAAAYVAGVNVKGEKIATRQASQKAIENLAPMLPELLGGSADLAPSNLTMWSGSKSLTPAAAGDANYIHYGVREFAMSAIMNGIVIHGGFIPYGGTFLVFSDYSRNAIRMAALMKIQSIFVFTHDSIGLGEDGPTHQPVEHVSSLRIIPGMHVWRPCDAVESAVSWKVAIESKNQPSTLIFSRQALPHQPRSDTQIADIEKGGYVLLDGGANPDAIIIATGSEVELAVAAAKALSGKNIRVVSIPCLEIFEEQDAAYKESVLPSTVTARVAVEAGVPHIWRGYVGLGGKVIGMTTFGESAPAGELFKHFGFTVDNVVASVNEVLS